MKLSHVASVYSSACNHLSSTSEYLELSLALGIGLKKLPVEGTRVPGHYTMKEQMINCLLFHVTPNRVSKTSLLQAVN